MRLLFHISLLISLLSTACKKIELPEENLGTPIFSISGTINNSDELTFTAGEDDYYMFTSFQKNEENVHTFSGEFRDLACVSDCRETLKISIRDNEVSTSPNINTALIVGQNYAFKSSNTSINTDTSYLLQLSGSFENPFNQIEAQYTWTTNTGLDFFEQHIEIALEEIMPIEVGLYVYDSINECSSTVYKTLFGDNANNDCQTDIIIQGAPILGYFLNVDSTLLSENSPHTFEWNTGSTNSTIPINGEGNYCLNVTDANDCISYICKSIRFIQQQGALIPVDCSADFSYQIEEEYETESDSLHLQTIIIEYVDEMGTIWRSDRAAQAFNSTFFNIDRVEDFDRNENNEATKELAVRFSVTLFDETLNELQLTDVEGVIGIAYPD